MSDEEGWRPGSSMRAMLRRRERSAALVDADRADPARKAQDALARRKVRSGEMQSEADRADRMESAWWLTRLTIVIRIDRRGLRRPDMTDRVGNPGIAPPIGCLRRRNMDQRDQGLEQQGPARGERSHTRERS